MRIRFSESLGIDTIPQILFRNNNDDGNYAVAAAAGALTGTKSTHAKEKEEEVKVVVVEKSFWLCSFRMVCVCV